MTNELILKIESFAKKECEFLGCLAQWQLVPEWLGNAVEIKDKIKEAGLKFEWMSMPGIKQGIIRACEKVAEMHSNKDIEYISDKGGDDHVEFVQVICKKERKKEKKDFDFNSGTRVTFNKQSGQVDFSGEFSEDVKTFYPPYKESLTTDDVRLFCRGVFIDAGGVIFHDGVYIIPNNKESIEKLVSLSNILQEIGVARKFKRGTGEIPMGVVTFAIPKGGVEQVFVGDCVYKDISKRINKIVEDAKKVSRKKSVLGKQEDLMNTEILLKTYSDLLQEDKQIEDLKEQIREAEKTLVEKAAELQN